MTNPQRRTTTRRGTALRALGAALLAPLAGLTLFVAPASAAPQGLSSTDWHHYVCDDGYYRIKTPYGQLLEKSLSSAWSQVVQNPDTGGYNQQWKLCHYENDSELFIFRNRSNENACLGIWKQNPTDPNEGLADGANFSVSDCWDWIYGNQQFRIHPAIPGSDQVVLRVGHSAKFAAVADPNGAAGSVLAQYSYRSTLFTLDHLAP
ncbi:RICIN domain-containing protein [Kitasatospora sp. NPDC058444]|uniref:RICIN domain-containing protein n=1 Tax=Kitasatospora sp. NPDC058444 TaxID=3346504 RepID=UPI00365C68BE